MRTIMLAVAAAAVAFMAAPIAGKQFAKAEGVQLAQVDVQVGPNRDRDEHRDRDRNATVGVGPGGVRIGPRTHCRMVTTTVQRGGRSVTTRERRCD